MDRKFLLKRNPPDSRDLQFPHGLRAVMPASVDLRDTGFVPRPLDQGALGSCVSNAVSNALRFTLTKQRLPSYQPSRMQNYYDARVKLAGWPANVDTGLTIRGGCQAAVKYGACAEQYCPYTISKFSAKPSATAVSESLKHRNFRYFSVQQTLNDLKSAISSGNVVICGILVFQGFMCLPASGLVPMPGDTEQPLGGHAQTLIGYSDEKAAFLSLNSWGPSFGLKGCSWIPYDYILNPVLAGDFAVVVAV